MRKGFFKFLAKLNRMLLPALSRQGVDPTKAKKWQLALLGYRYFVTKESLGD